MHTVGGISWSRIHLEVFENAESDQGDDSLTVGRDLVDGVAAVRTADCVDPVGAMSGEVAGPHDSTIGRRMRIQLRRQFSAVEGLAVGRGDLLKRGRVITKGDELARPRRPTAG